MWNPRARKKWSVNGKPHRITISLDLEICSCVRTVDAKMKIEAGKGWSIAKTVNILILSGILGHETLNAFDWNVIRRFSDGSKVCLEDFTGEKYVDNLTECP